MVKSIRSARALAALPLLLLACESSKGGETTPIETEPGEAELGHCTYTNKFSQSEECRQYEGKAWTEEGVAEDCTAQSGKLSDGPCSYDKTLGTCVLGEADRTTLVIAAGDDASQCSNFKLGCETFGGGTFQASEVCMDETPVDPSGVFQPPELICKDPLPGEPAGMGDGGKVCTWSMISGCTEPGRKFVDYASCGPVYTQRPYYPVAPPEAPPGPDPRLSDPAYVTELDWVKEQVEACACVCCHQDSITPKGAGVWDIEAEGNWMDTFTPYGLAFAGGFIPSWPLGAYPKEQNNGFERDMPGAPSTGMPTTDPARMAAFFKAELEHRGKSVDEYAGSDPTPEFFYKQATYKPAACEAGSGLGPGGAITWKGNDARYIYVLEADSDNPGVPPNLDLPAGTVWKLDVRPDQQPLKSGALAFGEVPASAKQAFPADGSMPVLSPGKTYYLYVLADVGLPVTRCLFDAPSK